MPPFPISSLIGTDDITDDSSPNTHYGGDGVATNRSSELPLLVQIQRYLVIAEHARWEAARSNDASARQSYLFIAEQWEKFAADLALYSTRRQRS